MARKKKPVSEETIEQPVIELVSFKAFFQDCLLKGLVKPWQEQEIWTFFRDLSLGNKEPSDKYKDALEKF